MIAHVCGLKRGDFVHILGDSHVYLNHIEPLKKQIVRAPLPFPLLKIKRQVQSIEDFRFEDFELRDYDSYPAIKMQMAV
jgi:thymidylate synthase